MVAVTFSGSDSGSDADTEADAVVGR